MVRRRGERTFSTFDHGENAMERGTRTLDQRPGSLPDIRAQDGGITFVMAPLGVPPGAYLVIRCDALGEVSLAIRWDHPACKHS
jgi:hypothetical protein